MQATISRLITSMAWRISSFSSGVRVVSTFSFSGAGEMAPGARGASGTVPVIAAAPAAAPVLVLPVFQGALPLRPCLFTSDQQYARDDARKQE